MRFRRLLIAWTTYLQVFHYSCLTLFLVAFLGAFYEHGILGGIQRRVLLKTAICLPANLDDDPYRCGALMNGGRWLDPPGLTQLPLSFNNWQPPGCMMHEYNLEDISTCLESRRIVLIGDSAIRNIFWATARKLDPKAADEEMYRAEKHVDLNFSRAGVAVEFFWDPFLNSSNLQQHLAFHRDAWDSEKDKDESMSTALLVIGGGLWHAKHFGGAALETFKASMETVVSSMIPGGYKTMTAMSPSGYPAFSTTRNILMISPVESPSLYPALAEPRLDPAKIRPLNEHLQKISIQEGAPVAWSYNLMTQGDGRAYQTDGFHVIDDLSRHRADVMLNLRCNADITRLKGYPMDKTCCNRYPGPTWVQTTIIIVSLIVLPLLTLISIYGLLT